MDITKWKKLSAKFGHGRSTELKDVDQSVAQFQQNPTLANLKTLAQRILDWQATKSNWLSDSIRAEPMRELVNLVKQTARVSWPGVGGRIFNRLHSEGQLAKLLNNPLTWLSNNALAIAGRDDGQRDFYLFVDHPDPTMQEVDVGPKWVIDTTVPRYRLADDEDWGAEIANAMCIKMHTDISNASSAVDVTNHLVPLAGNFMLTGMLNGCTFLIDEAGGPGALRCTHLKPVGQTPESLNDQITGFNLNQTRVYGQRDYGASEAVAILGLTKGSWQIYAQLTPRSGRTVTRVETLYP